MRGLIAILTGVVLIAGAVAYLALAPKPEPNQPLPEKTSTVVSTDS